MGSKKMKKEEDDKKLNKKTSEFIKMFESMGVKFIDIDTNEEIKEEHEA